MGQGEVGGYHLPGAVHGGSCNCMIVEEPWSTPDGPFSAFLHHRVQKMLLSPCRNSISGILGSFQSGEAFSGWRGLTIECSLISVILRATDDWKRALDCGQIVATVMIDLSKAFDTINHNLLLKKLYAYGIRGSELSWFTDYLAERKMRVVVDEETTDSATKPVVILYFVECCIPYCSC